MICMNSRLQLLQVGHPTAMPPAVRFVSLSKKIARTPPQSIISLPRLLLFPRHSSTGVNPTLPRRPFHRARNVARYTGYFCLSSVIGVLAVGTGLFIHDAFTYTEKHVDRVPVSPLALRPERGGPKNLPVVRVQVDDEEDEENTLLAGKPKLVIVGGGWGVSFRIFQTVLVILTNPGYGCTTNFTYRGLSCHCRFV